MDVVTNMPEATGVSGPPVIALYFTRGMEAFLANALAGLLNVGIDAGQIHVYCPENALEAATTVANRHSLNIRLVADHHAPSATLNAEFYSDFGSELFIDICWRKVHLLQDMLRRHRHVIYADIDISWLANPLPYLSQVAEHVPMAFQTEAVPHFPPVLCWGFVSMLSCERTSMFLDAVLTFERRKDGDGARLPDQEACRRILEEDASWLHDIFLLPEALFPNGLAYKLLRKDTANSIPIEGNLAPFIFHANWTKGLANKRELLRQAGAWFVSEQPGGNGPQPVPASARLEIAAPDTEPPAALDEAVITVIYPVFDLRGDIAPRVRRWTKQQDLDGLKYRVVVAAGENTDMDEEDLRKVLRPHDIILRVPGAGRDADYWNAGARVATTRWLLFAEAHGVPQIDSLSALASWIAHNPDAEAANFRVENLGDHRVGALMKRWFALIQQSWADPATWRRLHRVAFAIRADVFADVGPLESEYGQFAPPLLSARMDRRGRKISRIPTSSVIHDDSSQMSTHHADTADYARGELDARARNAPLFFETYFGPSALQNSPWNLPSSYARAFLGALFAVSRCKRESYFRLLKTARSFVVPAVVTLRWRARIIGLLIHLDELTIMYLPLTETYRWKRFLRAHRRVVQFEQMRWIDRQPVFRFAPEAGSKRWQIADLDPDAVVGVHQLERHGTQSFRWTHSLFLLGFAVPDRDFTVTFETRCLRGDIRHSDLRVVAGGVVIGDENVSIDDSGNVSIRILGMRLRRGAIDVVVIARALQERDANGAPGRILGLPLFSITVSPDS